MIIINPKLSEQELLKAIYRAAAEYSKLIGKSYLIIGKNKNSGYFYFQCYFLKKHFMHLLGIDSKTLNATEFYDECDKYNRGEGDGITLADCTPSRNHSRTTVNEKSSCCAPILRIQDAKYMQVGLKDLITQHVDFTYAYGCEATLGFHKENATSFPITLIPNKISNFATKPYRVAFVLEKEIEDDKYNHVLVEVKKGLFKELYDDFPEEIKSLVEVECC